MSSRCEIASPLKNTYAPELPRDVRENPIRNSDEWKAMRAACEQDLGAFHADIAASEIHWFNPDNDSWMSRQADGCWRGWQVTSGERVDALTWQPCRPAPDDSEAPDYRRVTGAMTHAAFNVVDRHLLTGQAFLGDGFLIDQQLLVRLQLNICLGQKCGQIFLMRPNCARSIL